MTALTSPQAFPLRSLPGHLQEQVFSCLDKQDRYNLLQAERGIRRLIMSSVQYRSAVFVHLDGPIGNQEVMRAAASAVQELAAMKRRLADLETLHARTPTLPPCICLEGGYQSIAQCAGNGVVWGMVGFGLAYGYKASLGVVLGATLGPFLLFAPFTFFCVKLPIENTLERRSFRKRQETIASLQHQVANPATVFHQKLSEQSKSSRSGTRGQKFSGHDDNALREIVIDAHPFSAELHASVRLRNSEIVNVLASVADVNACDDKGHFALETALYRFDEASALALVTPQLNVNQLLHRGNSYLHLAARADFVAVAQALIELGAKRQATDALGRRPLDLARSERMRAALRA